MLISATWQIVIGGVTLLSLDDWTDEEISLDQAAAAQESQRLRAPFADRFGRGGVSHALTFTRFAQFSTPALAQLYMISHAEAVAALRLAKDSAIFTPVIATGTATLERCLITAFSITAQNDRIRASYTLTGGRWSYAATGSPLLHPGGAAALHPDGSPILHPE